MRLQRFRRRTSDNRARRQHPGTPLAPHVRRQESEDSEVQGGDAQCLWKSTNWQPFLFPSAFSGPSGDKNATSLFTISYKVLLMMSGAVASQIPEFVYFYNRF